MFKKRKMLDLKIEIKESDEIPGYFVDGRAGSINFNGKAIGFMGEIHPKILRNWRIKMPVTVLLL